MGTYGPSEMKRVRAHLRVEGRSVWANSLCGRSGWLVREAAQVTCSVCKRMIARLRAAHGR